MRDRVVIAVIALPTAALPPVVVRLGIMLLTTRPWEAPSGVQKRSQTYEEIYKPGEQSATAFNDMKLQADFTYPWRTADMWSAQEQAALERFALQVRRAGLDLLEERLDVARY